MNRITTALLFAFLLASCSNKHMYWGTSKFTITTNALKDNERIKILYSGPPTNDKEYYTQLIAVSQESGDTVNILTTVNNGLTMADQDRVFNYFDENNSAFKISELNTDSLKNIKGQEYIDKINVPRRTKVLRDPRYDNVASNNFPTVIGIIGIKTVSDSSNSQQ